MQTFQDMIEMAKGKHIVLVGPDTNRIDHLQEYCCNRRGWVGNFYLNKPGDEHNLGIINGDRYLGCAVVSRRYIEAGGVVQGDNRVVCFPTYNVKEMMRDDWDSKYGCARLRGDAFRALEDWLGGKSTSSYFTYNAGMLVDQLRKECEYWLENGPGLADIVIDAFAPVEPMGFGAEEI